MTVACVIWLCVVGALIRAAYVTSKHRKDTSND